MRWIQAVIFFLIIRPLIFIIIGFNIQGKQRLPMKGPAIVAANHNSHLDTLTLMSIWPILRLHGIRPVAAADYFLPNPLLAWLTMNIMHIIPIERRSEERTTDPLAEPSAALDRGEILIIFPEGSRGLPEQMTTFKRGIARLAERHPNVPIVPIFMHGLGKSLPKGDFLLVPFFCDVLIGEYIYFQDSVAKTMEAYKASMNELAAKRDVPPWE